MTRQGWLVLGVAAHFTIVLQAFHVRLLPKHALPALARRSPVSSLIFGPPSSHGLHHSRIRSSGFATYNSPDDGTSSGQSVVVEEVEKGETDLELNDTAVLTASVGSPATETANAIFQLWKRRLWTKADYLHSHAVSGAAFMVLGALYVLFFVGDQVFGGSALAQAERGVVGWVPLAIMWTGVVNCISCLPMSKFRAGPQGGYDTKGAGFKGLGIGMTMLGIWTAYFFSGHYPSWMAPVDPLLALGFLAVIVHGIVNSEVALAKELEEKAPAMSPEGVWSSTPSSPASSPDASLTERETRTEIVLNHRVASYPNLLHLPVLYNVILGGQPWLQQVVAKFPLEPTLLFHASFGIAVANSIVFLGATLKDRKLMTLRQWLLLQVVVLTPFVTTVVDVWSLGREVSINPLEVYAGLMG
ncbi:hypothetical protein NSK_004730 [Nannochloropsis salina CCMP1776]|uniref:Uncharacterized protein n=1 Tax=Nannochloropsis salina CCMP1776 TaxID=1027361 RepID=A0A4D9CXC2_9STRA|nr:hypothetical protein NSK_004730 [Nannochloropsis salina CCMP1776]|eukprot:TFJ83626.1 hypothetical protein NSK_004730 [Nannochloropsis salina CCMP1776]